MIKSGTAISEVDAPSLLIDLDRVQANIQSWQEAIGAYGVGLRPHVKTHKVPEIAKMQLRAGATGITVAKLGEAEVFADEGCKDIFVAYPVIGAEKWRRAAEIARRCRLTIGVDSEIGARGLSAAAASAGGTIHICVEVDTGLNRAGVLPDKVAELCKLVMALPGLELDGLFTFRGGSFAGAEGRGDAALGQEEGEMMVALADKLRAAGIPIRTLSM